MESFIKFKREKTKHVFQILGNNYTEEEFIATFKVLYPVDWRRIQEVCLCKEKIIPFGKIFHAAS